MKRSLQKKKIKSMVLGGAIAVRITPIRTWWLSNSIPSCSGREGHTVFPSFFPAQFARFDLKFCMELP